MVSAASGLEKIVRPTIAFASVESLVIRGYFGLDRGDVHGGTAVQRGSFPLPLLVGKDQATAGRRGQELSVRACQCRFSQRGSATQVAYRSGTGDHSGVNPDGA
jgi:hypothetical protein